MREAFGFKGFCLLVLSLFFMAGAVQADPRQATLSVNGDMTCSYPNFVDHQVSVETYSFTLPDVNGPVSANGSYVNNGTGYTLTGIAAIAGDVRADAELVLTYLQWNYDGEWMNSEAPFVPTKGQPVVVPLEPGAEITVTLQNVSVAAGTSCSGTITYHIDFERETQIWDIALTAERIYHPKTKYVITDPQTGTASLVQYVHGVTFTYDMAAEVILERRKGVWTYREGKITRAAVKHDYFQNPVLYTVKARTCLRCDRIAALAGQSLAGDSDGTSLALYWPDIRPVVSVAAVFAFQCAPGPAQSTCEGARREESDYSDEDGDVLQRAAGHVLNLNQGTQPYDTGTDSDAYFYQIRHDYTLSRRP